MDARKIGLGTLALALLCPCSEALALGTVSRACRYFDIPVGLKTMAARFFYAVEAPRTVLTLPSTDEEDQKEQWILESLTTDYVRSRYWLYAVASVSGFVPANPNLGNYYDHWNYLWSWYSPDWTPQQISDAMRKDPYFAPYYANRQVLFSARAGDPNIATNMEIYLDGGYSGFRVTGYHYYYDFTTKTMVQLPNTSATDCNLPNLGLSTPFNR